MAAAGNQKREDPIPPSSSSLDLGQEAAVGVAVAVVVVVEYSMGIQE